jgi:hypothetical protein
MHSFLFFYVQLARLFGLSAFLDKKIDKDYWAQSDRAHVRKGVEQQRLGAAHPSCPPRPMLSR